MSIEWWINVRQMLFRKFLRHRKFTRRYGPRLQLEVLEDRIALDDNSAGFYGINARNLTSYPLSGQPLTGAGVLVGQVELERVGLAGFDGTAFLHPDVKPAGVFLNDGAPVANQLSPDLAIGDEDHATKVAGVIIADGGTNKCVAPGVSLYSADTASAAQDVLAFQHLAGLGIHIMNYSASNALDAGVINDGSSLLRQRSKIKFPSR